MIEKPEYEEVREQERNEEKEEDNGIDLQLSLHAVLGKDEPNIMRIRGMSQKKALKVLIDMSQKNLGESSTNNFLNSKVAEKVHCELIRVTPRAVEVANGQILQCNQKCSKFLWKMQGSIFQPEVYIINLESYDLILGGEWLSTLGEIKWDFNKLSMIFELEGTEIRLQGELWSAKNDHLHCHMC